MQQKLKIYLSGSYEEKEQILELWTQIETEMPDQVELTFNWMEVSNSTDTNIADLKIEGVRSCDVYIMYLTSVDQTRRGTCTEFGIAIGCEAPLCLIYLSEDGCNMPNVFLQTQENAEVLSIASFDELVKELGLMHETIQVCDKEILDSKIYTQ